MAFTEDLAPYFADFGIDATVGGVSVRGIFDAAYAAPLGMASSAPALTISAAAAPAVAEGDAVVIGATSYAVTAVEPDGTGMTLLRLRESS